MTFFIKLMIVSGILVFTTAGCGGMEKTSGLEKDYAAADEKKRLMHELETLAQSQVSERVLVAWVKRLKKPIALEVSDVIYLKNAGVSGRVIRTLIEGSEPSGHID